MRDELWERAVERSDGGAVIQVWTALNPQGFEYRQINPGRRMFTEIEGVALIKIAPEIDDTTSPPSN